MSSNKWKVGDRVTVKTDLIKEDYYCGIYFNPDMVKYMGGTYIVEKVNPTSISSKNYSLTGSDNIEKWIWDETMLQDAYDIPIPSPEFKIGDKVVVKERIYNSGSYRASFTDDMAKLKGIVLTIKSVNPSASDSFVVSDDFHWYEVYENSYHWSSGMLELVKEEKSNKEDSIEHAFSTRNYPEKHYYGIAPIPIYMPTHPSLFVPKFDLETPLKQISKKRIAKSDKPVILKLTHKSYKFK